MAGFLFVADTSSSVADELATALADELATALDVPHDALELSFGAACYPAHTPGPGIVGSFSIDVIPTEARALPDVFFCGWTGDGHY